MSTSSWQLWVQYFMFIHTAYALACIWVETGVRYNRLTTEGSLHRGWISAVICNFFFLLKFFFRDNIQF